MPVRLRRPRPPRTSDRPSRRAATATVVTAALVGGALTGILSMTGAQEGPETHTTADAHAMTGARAVPESGTTGGSGTTGESGAVTGPGTAARVPGPRVPAEPEAATGAPAGRKTAAKPVPAPPSSASVMQVVAHPDDDLFFMNPDISQSLHSDGPLASVYLTAGESDGVNARPRDAAKPAADKAGYAEARQNGIRAAYAEMATGSRTSPWDRVAIPTAGGAWAELDTLRAKPQVKLVWLQMHEAGSISGDRPRSLNGLWHGRVSALGSQRSAGTPVAADFSYTREQVVATMTGLLERFRPTFVRMQDPTPGTHPGSGVYRDHQDHLYGARFLQEALARYAKRPGHPHVAVQNYLGYPTGALPRTLDAEAAGAKLKTLKTYAWLDGVADCGTLAGCGDLKVAARPAGRGWTQTVRYSRGTSTSWVQREPDGGLLAFSVLDGRLGVWRKAADAVAWRGPELLPGDGVDAGVTSVVLPDGRVSVYGTRTVLKDYRREVVSTTQTAPGGGFGPWRALGTPERNDASGASDISAPAVAVGTDGRAVLAVRDSRRVVTYREQRADGAWGPWRLLGGANVIGDPVAATDASGRGYVFASTTKTVLAWARQRPGGPLTALARTGLPQTTLALSAAPHGDGVRLWFRKPASGDLRSADFSGTGPASPFTELPGTGVAGFGPVGGGDGLLAVRSRTGFLATASHGGAGTGKKGAGTRPVWTLDRFLFAGAPTAGADGVAAMGLDGRLHWTPAGR
ncbi:PIG-L family deacetylase [Streptomyces sp. NPDC056529]|uniref:PIG-L family deacetylase n=1 Tax=Streptomyces sp. NPDC056529 TaxID=3345855 RepID=UPI0036BB82E6